MGTGDHNAGGLPCDGLASHAGGSSNIPSRFMLQKPELSADLMGHLARMQTFNARIGSCEVHVGFCLLCFRFMEVGNKQDRSSTSG